MVGRIITRGEKGRGRVQVEYLAGLSLMTGVLYLPPGLSQRRAGRRLVRLEGQLRGLGVGRVVVPEGFSGLTRLRPVDTLPFYRAVADVLVLEGLRLDGVAHPQGGVTLHAPWLCPELRRAAQRLCPLVRTLRIDVPGEGEDYARWLHRQYGLPVAPPEGPADVTASFGPGERAQGRVLRLYGRPELGGLRLSARGRMLPQECDQQLLALLWEQGAARREELYVPVAQVQG